MGSIKLPQAQLSEIQQPSKRKDQSDLILQILGNNPLAQSINTVAPDITQVLAKRAQQIKQTQQVAQLAASNGDTIPPDSSLTPDLYEKSVTLKNAKAAKDAEAAKARVQLELELEKARAGSSSFDPATGKTTVTPGVQGLNIQYDEAGNPRIFRDPNYQPKVVPKSSDPGKGSGVEKATIYQDPQTGQISPSPQKGWISRTIPADKATALLAASFNQGANRDKPSSQTKSTAEFARTIIPHIDSLRNLIEEADNKGYIGPAAGRVYGQFLTGKVGSTGNPDADRLLGRLRATDSLMKTGTMKVHFGSRGGAQMYDHFSDMLNTGKQSKAVLNGSLDGIEEFMQGYSDAAPDKSGSTNTLTPLSSPKKATLRWNPQTGKVEPIQ